MAGRTEEQDRIAVLEMRVTDLAEVVSKERDARQQAERVLMDLRQQVVVPQGERLRQAEATTRRLLELLDRCRAHIHNEFNVETHVETYHRLMRDLDAALAGTGITKAELEFLQAKANGTLPANASWADWKASWTERKA